MPQSGISAHGLLSATTEWTFQEKERVGKTTHKPGDTSYICRPDFFAVKLLFILEVWQKVKSLKNR